jgi:hypothetical protein
MCFQLKNKNKNIIEFFNRDYNKLIKQLEQYINNLYNSNGTIYGKYTKNNYIIYNFEDKNKYLNLSIKCKIKTNILNYKIIIYKIITHL